VGKLNHISYRYLLKIIGVRVKLIENLTKRRVTARKAGRPKKDNKATDDAQDNKLILL